MTLSLPVSSHRDIFLNFSFVSSTPLWKLGNGKLCYQTLKKPSNISFPISCTLPNIVRSPSLDKHVVKQNKIRFVQKLKTLLLSKPKHYIPLHILAKCRSYLCLPKPRSILSMIHRYPTIFELFTIPMPPTPLNATKSGYQLCVRLTTNAAALATQEMNLKSAMSITLANKVQKLLMLSTHHRLLLSKLLHIAPDLGLLPNFRSRLCNDFPDKFKIVDTSYGRALELVSWDQDLACILPSPDMNPHGLIVDRPLKFKHLRLRKGLNLKRRHRDFLIKFGELPSVCPYNTSIEELAKESLEAEKRACALLREVLNMMVEKRTLIDHLTHFRKEFGLPNKLRALILRHPELFYVSLKGLRNSVLLVECFDDKGVLLEKDETLVIKEQLMELIREGKRMRRERRKNRIYGNYIDQNDSDVDDEDDEHDDEFDDDGFEKLFDSENSDLDHHFDDEKFELRDHWNNGELWTADTSSALIDTDGNCIKPW
ncbi:protein WHAT'S THIS FACTOR 1 homolog, chloroplastic [Mangifera indica]|uniref:protein WHAT'S THIS FACTOR 1 homolog, chloroplastic n=1 Tax=Mangifera indica TaxID=29780 RepID=UPI001CFC2CB6|nr:protein WHAT'S THIS FACTOR 1 homolog, chloroplastic [Mangifera indica]